MKGPAEFDDFRDVLAALLAQSAEFVSVGAHAMAVHGVPRATGDLDILVRPTEENAQRVFAALLRFGASALGSRPTVSRPPTSRQKTLSTRLAFHLGESIS